MDVLEYSNYKLFVLEKVLEMPNKGRGQFRRLAEYLNISPVIVSQVFKGDRELSLEQATLVCEYFGFSKLERDYFLLLVLHDRAGSQKLRSILKEQMTQLLSHADQLKRRLPEAQVITDEAKAMFYSSWYYSATRLLTSIEGFDSAEAISLALGVPLATIRQVLEFLLAHGLCVENDTGLQMGVQSTHVDASSPLVTRHHQNWRQRAMLAMESARDEQLFFTGPMSLSSEAMVFIRKELAAAIEKITDKAIASESEHLACLNIDWFSLSDLTLRQRY